MPTLAQLAPYFMIAAGIPLAVLTIYAFAAPRPSRSPDPDAAPKRSASGSNGGAL